MVFKFLPDRSGVGEVSAIAAAADDAIQKAAAEILAKAQALADGDPALADFAASLHIDTGTRPKGRGYARVVADSEDAAAIEWGDTNTAKLRILGQAANVTIFPA